MPSQLESLRSYTTVVADTGDIESVRQYKPTDATTNPSLILKAVQSSSYRPLLNEVVARHPDASGPALADQLLVTFGRTILEHIPGRVSTEVDARLSFDTHATIERARQLIALYQQAGIERERILIKIASTWEGIQAARQLQQEGINCNLTLLFSLTQAVACADAGVRLISPFVGRIYDWHKAAAGSSWDEAANAEAADPGVTSVSTIYRYYKAHDIPVQIMGASFRNIGQIRALAGCDLLTISPALLDELAGNQGPLSRQLHPEEKSSEAPERIAPDEITFRTALNADAMATEKLAEGIRLFTADAIKLDKLIEESRNR